jgi:ABC-type sugar transport system permease subunit
MDRQVTESFAQHSSAVEIALPGRAQAKRKPLGANARNHFYLLPGIVMVGVFVYYGIFFNIDISFYDWDGISRTRTFIGTDNYLELLSDHDFISALSNTVIWALITVFTMAVLGFLLAAMMSTNVRFKGLLSSVIVIPSVTASVVVAIIARQILGGTGGQLNELLGSLGLGGLARPWLADPSTALYALAGANIWQWTGFSFLLYYSALTLVSQEVVEAAHLDGANLWQIIWRVLFPLCRPTTYALAILGVIQSLKTFDIVYLTTNGGPGRATEVLSTYIFHKSMLDTRAGYAAAMSVALVVISLAATAGFLWLQQRRASDA